MHHLDPARAVEIMDELARFTADPQEERLCDLMACAAQLSRHAHHPESSLLQLREGGSHAALGDLAAVPGTYAALGFTPSKSTGCVRGTRTRRVPPLAEEWDLPVISGGDRHGCRPNTMLNLSAAASWGEFVDDVRNSRPLDVLVLPAYEEPVRFRELATAGDVLRRYPDFPYGRRRFTDRIWADVDGYSWHPLSFYLDGGRGTPLWLLPIVGTVLFLSHDRVRPVLRKVFAARGEYDRHTSQLRPEFASLATSLNGD